MIMVDSEETVGMNECPYIVGNECDIDRCKAFFDKAELLDKVEDMILSLPKKSIDNFDYAACALILNGLEELKEEVENE